MFRPFASLVVAATVILGSVTACPSGAFACGMLKAVHHRCCGDRQALGTRNCCGVKAAQPAALGAGLQPDAAAPVHLAWAVIHRACAPSDARIAGSSRSGLDGTLSPPDTLLTQHTALLL